MNSIIILIMMAIIFFALFIASIFLKQEELNLFKKWHLTLLSVIFCLITSFVCYLSFSIEDKVAKIEVATKKEEKQTMVNNINISQQIQTKKLNTNSNESPQEIEKKKINESGKNYNGADVKKKTYINEKGEGLIKGNTSKKTGEKIYHIPGSTYYDRTKIEDTERWFKTIDEAEKAGYRAPKR